MKKKALIFSVAAAVLLLVVTGMVYWQYSLPKFHDVTVELGVGSVPVTRFLEPSGNPGQAAFVTDMSTVDFTKVGTTPIVLRYGNREETVKLTVQDTVAPQVSFVTAITEGVGYEPKPEDFIVSAQDLSQLSFSFAQTPVIPEGYDDITVTVVVTDAGGNRVEQACVVSYSWIHSQVTLEYGELLTKEHLLLDPQKDADLIQQLDLDRINAAGVGVYEVVSTIGDRVQTCTVTIADTAGPNVELMEDVETFLGDALEAETVVVSAEDLSGVEQIRFLEEPDWSKEGQYTVLVEARDSLGNVTVMELTVQVVRDREKPQINGALEMSVAKGSKPNFMAGIFATDNRDGQVEVTCDASDVDLSKAGTYYVYYTATDEAGNTAEKKRKVIVNPSNEDTLELLKDVADQLSSDPEEIRDWVRDSIKYSSDWGGDDPVYYGLTKKRGNCYVHNMILKELLELKGYEAMMIWVKDKSHYWVMVNIDGTWWHIDATPGPTHTVYSLMNDELRKETLKGRRWDEDEWPAADGEV